MNKPRGKPFAPGNTAGRGRPKGSRNKTRSSLEQLLKEYEEPLARRIITSAAQGNASAMRACINLMSAPRRDRLVRLGLPVIRTGQDVQKAGEKITQAIALGKITPGEGNTMMSVLETQSKVIERVDLEVRLAKVEESLASTSTGRVHRRFR